MQSGKESKRIHLLLKTNDKSFLRRNYILLIAAVWFFAMAFVINNYWSVSSTPRAIQKTLEKNIIERQSQVSRFLEDSALLNTIRDNKLDVKTVQDLINKDFYIFLYQSGQDGSTVEKFWSTQVVQPDSLIIQQPDTEEFSKLSNGWFLSRVKSYTGAGGTYKFVCLIPVKWDYYIENKYLQNNFVGLPNIEKAYNINIEGKGLPIRDVHGKAIFYLDESASHHAGHTNLWALTIGIIALLMFLFFMNRLANYVAQNFGLVKGVTALVAMLLIITVLSYKLNPYNFRQLKLFTPSTPHDGLFQRSLGEILVNSLIFIWVVLFTRYHYRYDLSSLGKISPLVRYLLAFVISLIMSGITFVMGGVIITLISDHQISFDVLNFFSLDVYSFVGFIVLTCLATGYYFFVQLLIHPLRVLIPQSVWWRLMSIATSGLLILTFTGGGQIAFNISLLLWLVLFVFLLDFKVLLLHAYRLVSSRFIFWTFFFSVSITAVVIVENRINELREREKFAENLYNKADPTGPVIMNIILTDFRSEYLSKIFYRFKDPLESLLLKDSLLNESFSGYLNKYNTEIYTFDTSGAPLFNLRPATFNDLNAIIQTQGRPTDVPDLYYYDVSYSNFNYITRKTIIDPDGVKEGYIFIVAKPKQFRNEALYPELFSRGNKNALESSSEYAFAIYNKGTLATSYNDYPFSTQISERAFTHNGFKTYHKKGYEELWYRPQPGTVIIITRQDRFILESITLFAYLFCSFLLITLVFNIVGSFISDKTGRDKRSSFWQLTIRNQVHGTIILISVFSFIVIGVSSILFFINRYHSNNREFLSRTIHVMENELHNTIDSATAHTIITKSLDQVSKETLSQIINKVSDIHATDINLYNLNGSLEISSLPLPYENGILSDQMDPLAWYHLNKLKESQYFQEQKIGTLPYLSNYIPVRNENGTEYAYLNIPFFESQKKLQDEISNFLVAIINLNAFIFLIAGIIALFITNKITRSFSIISNKMREVNLQTGNEEIEWHRKDEIGDLVNEYNKMVRQLELSADKLARSEREGAWREMARQVAHEIKNPLTPMKLNLQYLQMAIERNSADVKSISLYVSGIILEQIDHLSKIASDFSQFANLGNTDPQLLDVNEVLESVVSLYATNEKVDINAQYEESLTVKADKTQLNRLFTNLLQNAVQSVPEFRNIRIEIKSFSSGNEAVITVKDNGIGIPAAMQSKIFMPNFTTKSSGTGLGLAMCKGIVERLNGSITFETKENEWTIFKVAIPLAMEDLQQHS